MTGRIKAVGLLGLVAAVAWLSYAVKREAKVVLLERLDVGDRAPDFSLADLEAQEVSLADYRGQVVVLNFWRTDCAQRKLGMPLLEQFHEEHRDSGVAVLSINIRETPKSIRGVLNDGEQGSVVLLDSDGRVTEAYGIRYCPTLVMVNQEGKIAWVSHGYLPDLGAQLGRQLEALRVPSAQEEDKSDDGDLD